MKASDFYNLEDKLSETLSSIKRNNLKVYEMEAVYRDGSRWTDWYIYPRPTGENINEYELILSINEKGFDVNSLTYGEWEYINLRDVRDTYRGVKITRIF